jgi:hypothetical protein
MAMMTVQQRRIRVMACETAQYFALERDARLSGLCPRERDIPFLLVNAAPDLPLQFHGRAA